MSAGAGTGGLVLKHVIDVTCVGSAQCTQAGAGGLVFFLHKVNAGADAGGLVLKHVIGVTCVVHSALH